jgi:hypothetical protein
MHHCPGTSISKYDTLLQYADHGSGANGNRDITLLYPEFFAVRGLQGMTFDSPKCNIVQQIWSGIHNGVVDDIVVKAITNLSASQGKSLQSDEWQKVDGLWYFCDKIYVPNIPNLR